MTTMFPASFADSISRSVVRQPQATANDDATLATALPLNRVDAFVESTTRWRYVKVHALFDTPWFASIVQNPDRAIDMPWTKCLKHDTSTTVALTSFDGQQVVIKRYNPRHPLYVVKRLLRVSRASHCLRASVQFSQAGIAVPQTVGVIEKRIGPLRGNAYYLMRYCDGILLSDWFKDVQTLRDKDQPVLNAVADMFDRLQSHALYHGDMKATNLVWQNDRLVVLDLDSARHCPDPDRLSQRLRSDKTRFLKNFIDRPDLKRAVESALAWR